MKPMTMIAAVVAGLSFVATASTFAQDRPKQAEPARRPAERPVQNDDAKRRAEADRTKTERPAPARTATEDERRRAEAGNDKARTGERTMTDEERRKAADRTDADKEIDARRKGLDRARQVHERNLNVRTAKLARLREIATQKNDKEMLTRIEKLEAQEKALDQRRRAAQAAEEDALKRGEPARDATREPAREPTREPSRDGK